MIRTLTLEILSAGPEDVARRRPFHLAYAGRRFEGVLQGSDALDADLLAWSRLDADAAVEERLAEALRALVLPVWPRVELDLEAARAAGDALRLDLVLNELELSGLPWELLQVEGFHLGLAHVPRLQLRYSLSNRPVLPARSGSCPVVLGWAGAVPRAEHERALREAWGADFDPARHVVEADLSALNARLREQRPAVLSLLCHGIEVAPGEVSLALRGPAGEVDRVSPKRLKEVLGQHELQLVVLCACVSGDGPGIDSISSAARELHAVGVPAVLASRLPLSARGSVVLTKALCSALKAGRSVEEAVLAAREELRTRDQRSRDAEALQLYAVGADTRLRVEAPKEPASPPIAPPPVPIQDKKPKKNLWIGLGVLALLGVGVAAWRLRPDPTRGNTAVGDAALTSEVLPEVVVPSLERSTEVRVGRAGDCGGAFGASVRLAQGSWLLVGDPAALGGRGQVYTYDKNDVGEGSVFTRYPTGDPTKIDALLAPLAGGPANARVGADLAEFGNGALFFAMGASEGGVPPAFDPLLASQLPPWLGPALEQALRGEIPLRATGWLAGNYAAFAMSTGRQVHTLLFGAEGPKGAARSFPLERAFLAGVYQEPSAGDQRSGLGLLASGVGGDCGPNSPCTVLSSYTASRSAWDLGGGPVVVGAFDGDPGLDAAVLDVSSAKLWILSGLDGLLDATAPQRMAYEDNGIPVPGLTPGALQEHTDAFSLVSLGTLDGDAIEDLAIGVPFTHDGAYGEGRVLVRLSTDGGRWFALQLEGDRSFSEAPVGRAVSLSYDRTMGPGGTLAIGATGLFAPDAATPCGGVALIEDPMRLLPSSLRGPE